MHSDHDNHDSENAPKKEPSLKDALMPDHSDADRSPEPLIPQEGEGDVPSLKDALLPKDHVPSPVPQSKPEKSSKKTNSDPKPSPKKAAETKPPNAVVPTVVAAAIVAGLAIIVYVGMLSGKSTPLPAPPEEIVATATPTPPAETPAPEAPQPAPTPVAPQAETPDWGDPGPMSLAAIQDQGLIIDVHEHIESLEEAPMFLAAMDELGIQKVCLMGSSKFTLTLQEHFGFTEYDENNNELIKIIEAYPGRFEAWPTLNPEDPEKLTKIQDLVARGATGVKLYTGHGYVAKDLTYMFHPVAMDDPGMLPFYAWAEENAIPLAFHVNPFKDKAGFAEEFIAVLNQFPDLKVIAPHFILSSVKSSRLEELLDTFPNLYTDVSFGDYFMKPRLSYISKYPKKFKALFEKYPNRFMFASDLVMIKNRDEDWAPTQMRAYIDMLSKESYTTAAIPGETLTGLALSDELLSRVLFRNYLEFRVKQPRGTQITRPINWDRMNVDPVERQPGQAFPPKPPKR